MTSIKSELAEIAAIDHTTLLSTATGDYGLTETGFVAKPFGRLMAEQLALARRMFGADVDIGPGSVLRRVIELSAVEHARTYAMLGAMVDDQTVPTARGRALDRLGEELGLPRPFEAATGTVRLSFKGDMPPGRTSLTVPVGARMLTGGGHHVALAASVALSEARREADVAVEALRDGDLVAVAPEGRISWSFELRELRTGAVRMAQQAGVPVLPSVNWGPQRVSTTGHGFRWRQAFRVPVEIRFGAPIEVGPDDDVEVVTRQLEAQMRQLLDEAQRDYPDGAPRGAWWVPARLGGSAPPP